MKRPKEKARRSQRRASTPIDGETDNTQPVEAQTQEDARLKEGLWLVGPAPFGSELHRLRLSEAAKAWWGRKRSEREGQKLRDETHARYEQEMRERRFQWFREAPKHLGHAISGFTLHSNHCPEAVLAVIHPVIDAQEVFARAAVELRLGCGLDPTRCYLAHANGVIYTLRGERQGNWEYWHFHKLVGDRVEGTDERVMIASLPDWFEWLRVPYDLDWQVTPVNSATEGGSRE
jgi:hypothetical protein